MRINYEPSSEAYCPNSSPQSADTDEEPAGDLRMQMELKASEPLGESVTGAIDLAILSSSESLASTSSQFFQMHVRRHGCCCGRCMYSYETSCQRDPWDSVTMKIPIHVHSLITHTDIAVDV